jgi:hypothetical protein
MSTDNTKLVYLNRRVNITPHEMNKIIHSYLHQIDKTTLINEYINQLIIKKIYAHHRGRCIDRGIIVEGTENSKIKILREGGAYPKEYMSGITEFNVSYQVSVLNLEKGQTVKAMNITFEEEENEKQQCIMEFEPDAEELKDEFRTFPVLIKTDLFFEKNDEKKVFYSNQNTNVSSFDVNDELNSIVILRNHKIYKFAINIPVNANAAHRYNIFLSKGEEVAIKYEPIDLLFEKNRLFILVKQQENLYILLEDKKTLVCKLCSCGNIYNEEPCCKNGSSTRELKTNIIKINDNLFIIIINNKWVKIDLENNGDFKVDTDITQIDKQQGELHSVWSNKNKLTSTIYRNGVLKDVFSGKNINNIKRHENLTSVVKTENITLIAKDNYIIIDDKQPHYVPETKIKILRLRKQKQKQKQKNKNILLFLADGVPKINVINKKFNSYQIQDGNVSEYTTIEADSDDVVNYDNITGNPFNLSKNDICSWKSEFHDGLHIPNETEDATYIFEHVGNDLLLINEQNEYFLVTKDIIITDDIKGNWKIVPGANLDTKKKKNWKHRQIQINQENIDFAPGNKTQVFKFAIKKKQ